MLNGCPTSIICMRNKPDTQRKIRKDVKTSRDMEMTNCHIGIFDIAILASIVTGEVSGNRLKKVASGPFG